LGVNRRPIIILRDIVLIARSYVPAPVKELPIVFRVEGAAKARTRMVQDNETFEQAIAKINAEIGRNEVGRRSLGSASPPRW
jgi:hypothetical protein